MEMMTKQEAVKKHRELWTWIAEQTTARKRFVTKQDYFFQIGKPIKADDIPSGFCYCCEYAIIQQSPSRCEHCPVKWTGNFCHADKSEYHNWQMSATWKEAAYWAEQIANLPERSDGE